jgi:hypothetical protein
MLHFARSRNDDQRARGLYGICAGGICENASVAAVAVTSDLSAVLAAVITDSIAKFNNEANFT